MFKKWLNFIQTDIWRIRLKDHPWSKSLLIRFLRVVVLAVRGFNENKCKFRASALTFFSLLSIVPVIALMFGIAKGWHLHCLRPQAGAPAAAGRGFGCKNWTRPSTEWRSIQKLMDLVIEQSGQHL